MNKFPFLRATEVIKILKKLNFILKRQQGSHIFFQHCDGRTTVIPNHPGEKLDRGLLIKIIKHDLKMNKDDFLKLLK